MKVGLQRKAWHRSIATRRAGCRAQHSPRIAAFCWPPPPSAAPVAACSATDQPAPLLPLPYTVWQIPGGEPAVGVGGPVCRRVPSPQTLPCLPLPLRCHTRVRKSALPVAAALRPALLRSQNTDCLVGAVLTALPVTAADYKTLKDLIKKAAEEAKKVSGAPHERGWAGLGGRMWDEAWCWHAVGGLQCGVGSSKQALPPVSADPSCPRASHRRPCLPHTPRPPSTLASWTTQGSATPRAPPA